MKVAFDGAPLDDGDALGVATSFLTGLRAYAARWPGSAVLLLPKGARDPAIEGLEIAPAPRGAFARQLALPRLVHKLRAAVLHSPVASVPLACTRPMIATVHDLPWLCTDSGETASCRHRLATNWSLRRAAAVIAPSQFTLAAAARALPSAAAKRLRCIPHSTILPSDEPVDPARREGPLLTLGDERPRKNRTRVTAAIALARKLDDRIPEPCFAGPPYNYVDERGKQALLDGCRALLHCSLFEGFGLPVLEGLAHGIPVLCSDLEPHREIAGDAALFVDPRDPGAMRDGIVRICTDDALRAQLAAAGRARARSFTPEIQAAAWRALHEELIR
ncbi:MAG: glycosyltransferase [Planctomycetota bacterium]